MKKLFLTVVALVSATLVSGWCCGFSGRVNTYTYLVASAKRDIQQGKASCVLIQKGIISYTGTGKGIAPLLKVYNEDAFKMKDAVLVDKVIGKAAAMIALSGGVKQVHTEIICDSAYDLLVKEGVLVTFKIRVENILNNRRDDLCPMEKIVKDVSDPALAIRLLNEGVAKMAAQGK